MARRPVASGVVFATQLLLALVTAQSLNTSDTFQGPFPNGSDQIQLSPPTGYPGSNRGGTPRFDLVNLTSAAVTQLSTTRGDNIVIHDGIYFIPPNTTYDINQFSSSNIAIIPCDPAPGFIQPIQAVEDAVSRQSPAIILYSATQNFCNLTVGDGIPSAYVIYSTTNASAWQSISQARQRASFGGPYPPLWYIGRSAVLDNVTAADQVGNGPPAGAGNGAPSTAVAMIILYSITGVITALFLIIIVTGAVRAHRHPERYGPRNVHGRPRQSRAKGLARAMLETIPIVKFGEREEDRTKPIDVELASQRDVSTTGDAEIRNETEEQKVAPEANERDTGATIGADKRSEASGVGITPAGAVVASSSSPSQEEGEAPGCSICTEDFERGQDVRVLPCQHSFHPACIDPWLLNVSGTCPLCRIDLRPADQRETKTHPSAEGVLPPPLDAEGAAASGLAVPQDRRASRRLSGFITDFLNPSRMQTASREERIAALRQLRAHGSQSGTDEAETRRRRRLTGRLSETLNIRTRARGTSPVASDSMPVDPARDATEGASTHVAEHSIPEEPRSPAIPSAQSRN